MQRSNGVLIVGAGLVGLTAALALDHHGVPVRVVERHASTSRQPKARRFNFRTMEIFRSYGVSAPVYAAAEGLAAYQGMRAGRTLREAEPLPPPPNVEWGGLTAASPEISCLVAQDLLEPVLLRQVTDRGIEVRFGTELVGLDQDDAGVTATLSDQDRPRWTERSEYLVGADGPRSTVRELLGITRSGLGTLGRAVSVVFHADLTELTTGREFNLCQIEHPDVGGAFASVDGHTRWLYYTGELHPVPDGDLPGEDAKAWADVVRTALGMSDVDVRIESVQAWEPAMLVADRFVSGRVLLAGDAAHVMPPYAAAGANTGIQDTADLAWKLAMIRDGSAGPALLETYHTERHAAGYHAAEQSALRTAGLRALVTDPDPALDHPFALVAGFGYPDGAIVDDGSPPQPTDRLALTGRPGSRMPHGIRRPAGGGADGSRDSRPLPPGWSTLDLVGTRPTLLTGSARDAWRDAARRLGIPVAEAGDDWAETAGVGPDGAVLVRPDHIVAWRATGAAADPEAALDDVLATVLHRP